MINIENNGQKENGLKEKARNKIKNKTKKLSKAVIKAIIKAMFKLILIIAIPIFIVTMIISACYWFLTRNNGIWEENEIGNPNAYTSGGGIIYAGGSQSPISVTDGIKIDPLQTLNYGLLAMGYEQEEIDNMTDEEIIELLDMNSKLKKTVTNLSDCTNAEILWCLNDTYSKYLEKPEDLQYLLDVELITQFPKIEGVSDDKLNGTIQFARIRNIDDLDGDGDIDLDDQPMILSYISNEEFEQKFNDYETSGNQDVFNYYTIDEEMNAVVAYSTEETGNFESNNTSLQSREKIKNGLTEDSIKNEYNSKYTVTENTEDKISATYTTYTAIKKKINFRTYVEKYTLPFNYLWALLVISRDDDFVLDLAELAYNSQIVIGIYDSITTTVTIDTKNYTENFREKQEEHYLRGGSIFSTDWTETSYNYYERNTITYISNTIQIDILYANTWIVELKTKYKKIQNQEPSYTPNPVNGSDEDWSDNGTYSLTDLRTGTRENEDGEEEEYTYTVIETYYKQKKITGQTQQTQQDMTNDKYEDVETEIKEKTDIDENTDQNFVKVLINNYNARTILFSNANVNWLVDILEENSNTTNMIELTRYLINKAKDPNDTTLTFDFSIFEPDDLTEITSIQNLSTYLRQFSHTNEAAQSSDGKYYLMYGDGTGWPTIGNADIQWKSHYMRFAKSGKVLQNGIEVTVPNVADYVNGFLTRGATATYSNEEIYQMQIYIEKKLVDEVGDELQSTYYNTVLNETSGLNLSKQQLYALTEIAYNFGSLQERNGYTFKQVYEAGAAQYEINSWEHNKFIWDNWWAYLGGMTKDGGLYALLEARDGAYETYVKGIYDLKESKGGAIFSRTCYVFYTQEQIAMYDYARNLPYMRTSSSEEEIFTYVENKSGSNGMIMIGEDEFTTYTNSSEKTFIEYKQNLGPWADMPYGSKTIGIQGCSITSIAITLSGYGYDFTPREWSSSNLISVSTTIKNYLKGSTTVTTVTGTRPVDSTNKEDIKNHLKKGDAVIIHVYGAGHGGTNLYTDNEHWMVLLDINENGDEVYVSNPYDGTKPNGWNNIDTVLNSMCFYIKVSE